MVGLFGEPLDFSAPMAVTERYSNDGVVTTGNIQVLGGSGASECYCFDGCITPGLRGQLSNCKNLTVPRKVTTAGNHELTGNATGFISGIVIDTHGQRKGVGLSIVVVSERAKSLF